MNSTVAVECGRFYDRDIMVPLDICVQGTGMKKSTVCKLKFGGEN